jgi:hypothetical protein
MALATKFAGRLVDTGSSHWSQYRMTIGYDAHRHSFGLAWGNVVHDEEVSAGSTDMVSLNLVRTLPLVSPRHNDGAILPR